MRHPCSFVAGLFLAHVQTPAIKFSLLQHLFYFPPHLFSAPLLYLVTQATNLTDIHSDKYQNHMVKSVKGQDKNADKTFRNKSRQSEQMLKVSTSVSFHAFTQISNF